jgi:hypothetical protein
MRIARHALLGTLVLLLPALSHATPTGQVTINGDAVIGTTFLNWLCDQSSDSPCLGTAGDFVTNSPSTGSFAQYFGNAVPNSYGKILDLSNAGQPLNTPFSDPLWITFNLNSNINLELTFIPLGTDTTSTTCAGLNDCTPVNAALITANDPAGLSAFNLDYNGVSTVLSFGLNGIVHDTTDNSTAPFVGVFTTQFAGETPQQVEAALATTSGIDRSYSATLVVGAASEPVPEPTTISFLIIGLMGMGLIGRRRRLKT